MSHVTVGFVAPVTESSEHRPLTLDAFVDTPPPGRFYMTVETRTDVPVALTSGDLLIVDTTRRPRPGALVVTEDGDAFAFCVMPECDAGQVFGVVTHVLVQVGGG